LATKNVVPEMRLLLAQNLTLLLELRLLLAQLRLLLAQLRLLLAQLRLLLAQLRLLLAQLRLLLAQRLALLLELRQLLAQRLALLHELRPELRQLLAQRVALLHEMGYYARIGRVIRYLPFKDRRDELPENLLRETNSRSDDTSVRRQGGVTNIVVGMEGGHVRHHVVIRRRTGCS
jgi:hypothetical protein